MKIFFILGILVPVALATSCSKITDCVSCDSLKNDKGEQLCSWCAKGNSCVPKSGIECVFGQKISEKTDCPIKIKKGYEYNETLAKKLMFISGAAYTTNPEVCLAKDVPDLLKQLTVKCDSEGDTCSAYSAVSVKEKAIILSFRGTRGQLQLLLEADYAVFYDKTPLVGGGNVCKYFNDGFYALWNGGLKAELNRIKRLYPTYQLWVTGHSMGAALAAVAGSVIAATNAFPAHKLKLMTFGEPRVGDRQFMIAHDQLLPYNYRITHGRDIVTHVPPKIVEGYHHHRYEVWYDNDMKVGDEYIVCLSPEDKMCSDQHLVQLSTVDHQFYFGLDVLDLINNGCKP